MTILDNLRIVYCDHRSLIPYYEVTKEREQKSKYLDDNVRLIIELIMQKTNKEIMCHTFSL